MKFWPAGAPVADALELRSALREGTILATGKKLKCDEYVPIDPVTWTALPFAPLIMERQYPYEIIWIDRDALLRLFPALTSKTILGRPPKYDWEWVRRAAQQEEISSLSKLAIVLVQLYKLEFDVTISDSQMKRQLRNWGYGGSEVD
jgi:hypothetical protein